MAIHALMIKRGRGIYRSSLFKTGWLVLASVWIALGRGETIY
jgi:hypothetical protein